MPKQAELPVGFEDLRGREFRGRYEIDELVHASPRRVTFAGRQPDADRRIVLDLIRPSAIHDQGTLERFERRIAACGRVRHPAIHNPLESGELFDGKLYLVTVRPPGEPLDRHLERHPPGRLGWADARPLLLDLVRGLAAAHARHLVHGRLSPACCWVERPDFGVPSLRVLDLGVNIDPSAGDAELQRTKTVAIVHDAAFMAPESAGGILGDERSDAYLTGLVAWFMLIGRPPFQADNPFQVASMHMGAPVPAMREAGVDVPAEVETLVRRLLAKAPHQRLGVMTELEQAILGLDEDGQARAAHPATRDQAQRRRNRARAGQARASREDVVQRHGTSAGGPRNSLGHRLPGQEIVDARWVEEPRVAPARPSSASAAEEHATSTAREAAREPHSSNKRHDLHEGLPLHDSAPPPASISDELVLLTRDQLRALRAGLTSMPSAEPPREMTPSPTPDPTSSLEEQRSEPKGN